MASSSTKFACPACTFENAAGRLKCEICDSRLAETGASGGGGGGGGGGNGGGSGGSSAIERHLVGRVRFAGLPMQTDAAHAAVASNQCSWVAAEFVRRGAALVAAAEAGGGAGDAAAFRAAYVAALRRGSALRAAALAAALRGGARAGPALPMGENVDNAGVRAAVLAPAAADASADGGGDGAGALPAAALGAPQAAVLNAAALSGLRAMAAFDPLGALAFAQIDPARAGVARRADGPAALAADLAALGPLGFVLACRKGQSLAVVRARGVRAGADAAADDAASAFLLLDSHCSTAGLTSLAEAARYVLAVEEGNPEVTWVVGRCAEGPGVGGA